MKRIAVVLMIFFTVSLLGGLCSVFSQLHNVGKQSTEYVYMEQLPAKMPNLLPDPMTGIPLY